MKTVCIYTGDGAGGMRLTGHVFHRAETAADQTVSLVRVLLARLHRLGATEIFLGCGRNLRRAQFLPDRSFPTHRRAIDALAQWVASEL